MAQPSPSISGAEGIRSLKDNDAVLQAFDAYPWTKDQTFMSGLYAILGDPNSESQQRGSFVDMATHARIFYYAQRIGVTVDFAAYQSWLAQHPEHNAPRILPNEYISTAKDSQEAASDAAPALPWQQAAPKADLYVDKSAAGSQSPAGGEPNYPMGFAEMLKLLQEGKEIPGIRQIPNTVARGPSVKPVGPRVAPRKPWERDVTPVAPGLDITKTLDTEFPPLDGEQSGSLSAEA